MIKVYIGPNGYGKTTQLQNEMKSLIASGVPESEILFLESEILLMEEVKDTKDETKTMEFIVQEILMQSQNYVTAKTAFENQVSLEIINNQVLMNTILDDVLSINNSFRNANFNFIAPTGKIAYKGLVKIDTKELKNKTGSGQRMQLILGLVKHSSSKRHIFLDEPEKYSHPSLLHKTAKMIMDLNGNGINVYIATHSPKLLSMLDVSFDNLMIINDSTHMPKTIDFMSVVSSFSFRNTHMMDDKSKNCYDVSELPKIIKKIYYRDFIEALFSNKIYLCEGVNDKFFIMKALQNDGKFFEDYCIFQTFGKYSLPIFERVFSSLGIKTQVFFDEDTKKRIDGNLHKEIDDYLETLIHYEFKSCLEEEIGYSGKKENVKEFINYLETFSFQNNVYIKI